MATTTTEQMESLTEQLLKAAAEYAVALLVSHQEEPCSGPSCECLKLCGSADELLKLLHEVAPAIAALPTAEEEQVWVLRMHKTVMFCFGRVLPELTKAFELMLSGGHSAEAMCSLADAYDRCGACVHASNSHTCTQLRSLQSVDQEISSSHEGQSWCDPPGTACDIMLGRITGTGPV